MIDPGLLRSSVWLSGPGPSLSLVVTVFPMPQPTLGQHPVFKCFARAFKEILPYRSITGRFSQHGFCRVMRYRQYSRGFHRITNRHRYLSLTIRWNRAFAEYLSMLRMLWHQQRMAINAFPHDVTVADGGCSIASSCLRVQPHQHASGAVNVTLPGCFRGNFTTPSPETPEASARGSRARNLLRKRGKILARPAVKPALYLYYQSLTS